MKYHLFKTGFKYIVNIRQIITVNRYSNSYFHQWFFQFGSRSLATETNSVFLFILYDFFFHLANIFPFKTTQILKEAEAFTVKDFFTNLKLNSMHVQLCRNQPLRQ